MSIGIANGSTSGAGVAVTSAGYRRYVLALLTAIYAIGYADRNIINLLLDSLKAEFHLSDTLLGLMTGFGFTLLQLAFIIPFARVADRGHRVAVLSFGLALWSTMTGLSGLAGSAMILAAARMGVGVGEACLVAPAQSILSGLFDKNSRPRAFAIMGAGADIGIVFGLVVGGWVAHRYGWRAAFFTVGAPGLVFALLLRTTVRDQSSGKTQAKSDLPLLASLGLLWNNLACRNILYAGAVIGINIYAMQVWTPSFLRRVHHLSIVEIGSYMGLVRAITSVFGAVAGGFITEALAKRNEIWRLRTPAVACFIACPASIAFLFLSSDIATFVALGVTVMMIGLHLGPTFAALQSVVGRPVRGLASACFMLGTQLAGLGIGSFVVGALSDALHPHFGELAMRYALLIPALSAGWAGWIFWRAAPLVPPAIKAAEA